MKEWQQFVKVRSIMKKIDHPLMVETYNNIWSEFQSLNIKPNQLENSIATQDFLREALRYINSQAKGCLFSPYTPIQSDKTKVYNNMISDNSVYMLEILDVLNEY